jgi:rhodanese-related sulfurtransferase
MTAVRYIGRVIQNVTPRQAEELISRGDVEIIDVREPHEWTKGHIAGARHVPLGQLRAAPKAALVHDGLLFVCAAGVRSETAARLAASLGFTRVFNLATGTRGWIAAGLPLVDDLSVAV